MVIKEYGGPEVLQIEERPDPIPQAGYVTIEVKAFGLNHAEIYFRKGVWGDVAEITGIECVGLVKADPNWRFKPGQKVMALVGGLGRSLNGSYAELVQVPSTNVVAVETELPWEVLAAIPESYATAWTSLIGILAIAKSQIVAIRGATSALGQAAVNIAAHAGAHVIATTRNASRMAMLEGLGAKELYLELPQLAKRVRERHSDGIDAVLDIVGNTTILDSLALLRRGGHACLVWSAFSAVAVRFRSNPYFKCRAAAISASSRARSSLERRRFRFPKFRFKQSSIALPTALTGRSRQKCLNLRISGTPIG